MSNQLKRSERLVELDAAKFIAMLLMMVGHALDALVRPDQLDVTQPPWSYWHWWRGITAPIFLTISGMLFSLTLSRNEHGRVEGHILRRRVLRAVQLVAIGYLLMFPVQRIYELPLVDDESWRRFCQVNILQLVAAGLATLVGLAFLFPQAQRFRRVVLIAGAVVSLLTPLVHSVEWYEHLPALFAAYLSYEGGSLFPVFPFAAYMLIGAWIGASIAALPNRRANWLRRFSFQGGVLLVIVGSLMGQLIPSSDIYRYTPAGVAIREGVALLFLGIVSVVLPLFRSIQSLLVLFGKQALSVYVLHLVFLFGTPWFNSIGRWYPKALSLGEGLLAAGAIVMLTLGAVFIVQQLRPYLVRPAVLRFVRISAAGLIAYLLLA